MNSHNIIFETRKNATALAGKLLQKVQKQAWKLSIGLMVASTLAATSSFAAADGSLSDTNIQYIGRWVSTNSTMSSYWGGAYIKVNFSGTTIKMTVNHSTCYYAQIDGGSWITHSNVNGTINLTPTPLANGNHTLSVAQGKDYDYQFSFQGFTLDAGATTSLPTVALNWVEYIGDSITAGYTDPQSDVSDYAWICAQALNCEHTQIAYPGISLVNGFGVNNAKIGMDVQYFKQQSLANTNPPPWDFTTYTPRAVVINLGQNDQNASDTDAVFTSDHTNFLTGIRAKYPSADMLVMRTFLGTKASATLAAVNAMNAAGDKHIHYVDTTGWLSSTDYNDGVHPSVAGHIKAANLLKPILAAYVTNAVAAGTYKMINLNSGLAADAAGQNTTNGTPIQQFSYNGGSNQQWLVAGNGHGQYTITGVQSGRVMDVKGQSTANGALIQLHDFNGGSNERWAITPTTNGYNTVQGIQSGKLMEVAGSALTNKAAVDQWSSTGGNNQQWSFQAP